MRSNRGLLVATVLSMALACNSVPLNCGCPGFQTLPQGSYSGPKNDAVGAVRLTSSGFDLVNTAGRQLLNQIVPGLTMTIPVGCTVQSIPLIGSLTIADQGQFTCTSEACGQMDGVCNSLDLPHDVTIRFGGVQLNPKGPDRIEARIEATVETGTLYVSSVSRNSPLCILSGGGPVKCSVEFNSGLATPTAQIFNIQLKLAIDTAWDRLLSLEVVDVGGTRLCTSSPVAADCIDPGEVSIQSAGACASACSTANTSPVKQIIIDQLVKPLKDRLSAELAKVNCAECVTFSPVCPMSPLASAQCVAGTTPPQGVCTDTSTNKCVPKLLGMEGRVDVATLLASLGAPPNTGVDFSVAVGGNVQADDAGLTLGLRGGLVEFAVSPCVRELMRPPMSNLPIPDFAVDAPGPYDLALSMSHQLLSEALFRAQQSGALCLELGSERITVLDSSLLATLLPSLNKLTHGEAVPLRIIVRPVNPPTAVVGRGTFDSAGKPIDPLIRLDWPGLELDLYARIDDRYVRIFTIVADLELPLGLNIDACGSSVTPVVGSLTGAVKNVNVINSEMLAEELDSLKMLVPTLLSLAEPSLANGLSAIAVPELPNLRVRLKLLQARGVGQRTGTSLYNHLGIYGQFVDEDAGCPVVGTLSGDAAGFVRELANGAAELSVPEGTYSVRVDNGLWLIPQATVGGSLHVEHPRLRLGGAHRIDVRDQLGTIVSVVTP